MKTDLLRKMYAYGSRQYLTMSNSSPRPTPTHQSNDDKKPDQLDAISEVDSFAEEMALPLPPQSLREWLSEITLYLVYLVMICALGPLQFGFHLVCLAA
jgi:hypothetical protein